MILQKYLRPGYLAALWIVSLVSSCAYQMQVIQLNPPAIKADETAVQPSGHPLVLLSTRDGRASAEIGRRSSGSRNEAPITTDTDIAALLQTQMTAILKSKGIGVLTIAAVNAPTLHVELKELSYRAFDEGGERKVKIQVVLETNIKNGPRSWRNTFQAQREQKIIMEPVAKTNEEWINETFADALKQLANDSRIYSYLTPG